MQGHVLPPCGGWGHCKVTCYLYELRHGELYPKSGGSSNSPRAHTCSRLGDLNLDKRHHYLVDFLRLLPDQTVDAAAAAFGVVNALLMESREQARKLLKRSDCALICMASDHENPIFLNHVSIYRVN